MKIDEQTKLKFQENVFYFLIYLGCVTFTAVYFSLQGVLALILLTLGAFALITAIFWKDLFKEKIRE